jgi:hypothetical protein
VPRYSADRSERNPKTEEKQEDLCTHCEPFIFLSNSGENGLLIGKISYHITAFLSECATSKGLPLSIEKRPQIKRSGIAEALHMDIVLIPGL